MHGVEGMAVRLLGCFLAWWHWCLLGEYPRYAFAFDMIDIILLRIYSLLSSFECTVSRDELNPCPRSLRRQGRNRQRGYRRYQSYRGRKKEKRKTRHRESIARWIEHLTCFLSIWIALRNESLLKDKVHPLPTAKVQAQKLVHRD